MSLIANNYLFLFRLWEVTHRSYQPRSLETQRNWTVIFSRTDILKPSADKHLSSTHTVIISSSASMSKTSNYMWVSWTTKINFDEFHKLWFTLVNFWLQQPQATLVMDAVRNPVGPASIPLLTAPSLPVLTMDMLPLETTELPEMEKFTVELKKDLHGLGITIAGYVCEKGELRDSKKKKKKKFSPSCKQSKINFIVYGLGIIPELQFLLKLITKNRIFLSRFWNVAFSIHHFGRKGRSFMSCNKEMCETHDSKYLYDCAFQSVLCGINFPVVVDVFIIIS